MRSQLLLLGLIALWTGAQAYNTCFNTHKVLHCSVCRNDPYKCYECSSEFGFDADDKCVACPANCKECNNKVTPAVCTECKDKFYKDTAGACTACGDNCKECSATECTECDTGLNKYIINTNSDASLNKKKCVDCGTGCADCTSDDSDAVTCTSCKEGYRLSGTPAACTACSGNCKTCSVDANNAETCSACKENYFLSDDKKRCDACKSPCTACGADSKKASGAKCTTCVDGYYLTQDSVSLVDDTCTICSQSNCKVCTATECTTCKDGYYKDAGGTCIKCGTSCKECTAADTCAKCDDTYSMKDAADVTCDKCVVTGCADCTASQNKAKKCQTCSTGYTKVGDVCKKCDNNCKSCNTNGEGKCDSGQCKTDYVFASPAYTCFKIEKCTVGSRNTTDNWSKCTTCATGYTVSDDEATCFQCPDGCNQCTHNSTTTPKTECVCAGSETLADSTKRGTCSGTNSFVCKEGYYYDDSGSGFPTCTACSESKKCKECNSTSISVCYSCQSGYVFDSTTDSCLDCPNNCDNTGCDIVTPATGPKTQKCKACKADSYRNGDACTSCNALCSACTGPALTDCSAPKCDANCNTCAFDSGNTKVECSSCKTGYTADASKVCQQDVCPANCAACSADTNGVMRCTTCKTTYGKNSGLCSPCGSNCEQCSVASGKVTNSKSKTGYYLVSADNECKKCDSTFGSGCLECSASACSKCSAGTGLTASKSCDVCATVTGVTNCATCDGKECQSCKSGNDLSFDKTTCHASSQLANCAVRQDRTAECTQCNSTYAYLAREDDGKIKIPMRCQIDCKKCGGWTKDLLEKEQNGTALIMKTDTSAITGTNDQCNKENGTTLESTKCEGICGSVVVGLDDKKVPIKVAKGCYEANLTLAGLVMQRIQSDDQASEVQSTCSGADATQRCLRACYNPAFCNQEIYNSAGALYTSVALVAATLLAALGLRA